MVYKAQVNYSFYRLSFKMKFITIILLLSLSAKAQTKMYPFNVEGSINLDTGRVEIELIADSSYYPQGLLPWKGIVLNKKFYISGEIPGPIGVHLSCTVNKAYYVSNVFVLDPGSQTIEYDIKFFKEIKVNNRSMQIADDYKNASVAVGKKFELWEKERDSLLRHYEGKIPDEERAALDTELTNLYREADEAKKEFIRKNPGSYLAFWNFVYLFQGWGYEPYYNSIYNLFSQDIKGSYAGKALDRNLSIADKLSKGKIFPFQSIVDAKGGAFSKSIFKKNIFTLVDLWFSSCSPCRDQFPELIEIYNNYHSKGFDIVGISTDKIKYKAEWINAIEEFKLPWLQYWDKNGEESQKLSINAFPTSFLLDSEGRILLKNIRPAQLREFLRSRLK